MKKDLFLITAQFPYGLQSEIFIETEILFLKESFNIIILPLRKCKNKREIDGIQIEDYLLNKDTFKSYYKYITYSLFKLEFYRELAHIKMDKDYFKKVIILLKFLARSYNIKKSLEKNLTPDKLNNSIFYSYWLDAGASGIRELNTHTISRAHGYDLYKERAKYDYQPLKERMCKQLSKVFPISMAGKKYLETVYAVPKDKIKLSYLGINGNTQFINRKADSIKLISCSNLAPVKRIKLLIRILAESNLSIEWTHIGGDEEGVKSLIDYINSLPKKFKFKFQGNLKNSEVMEFYNSDEPYIFINISESEGLPVSIMEAMSYSYPVLATNVGGTSEIVNINNGQLLSKDFNIVEFEEKLVNIFENYEIYSKEAFNTYQENFMASKNYKLFANYILDFSSS